MRVRLPSCGQLKQQQQTMQEQQQSIADLSVRYGRFATHIKEQAENGEVDMLHAYSILCRMEAELGEMTAALKAQALDAARSQIGKESGEVNYKGFKVTVRGGRKLWDYSNIEEHGKLKVALSQLEKDAQAAFEASMKGNTHVGPGGEVMPMAVLKGVCEPSLSIKAI